MMMKKGLASQKKQACSAVAYPGPRDPLSLMSKSVIPLVHGQNWYRNLYITIFITQAIFLARCYMGVLSLIVLYF